MDTNDMIIYRKAQKGIRTENMYTNYPALRNIGQIDLIPDTAFTKEKTDAGSIEYIAPGRDAVTYDTGYTYRTPSKKNHKIVYNPNTEDQIDIELDAVSHGLRSDPKYLDLVERAKQRFVNSRWVGDFEREWRDRPNADGKEHALNNYIDGMVRTRMLVGRGAKREEFEKRRYWPDAENHWFADPAIAPIFDKIHKYITNEK